MHDHNAISLGHDVREAETPRVIAPYAHENRGGHSLTGAALPLINPLRAAAFPFRIVQHIGCHSGAGQSGVEASVGRSLAFQTARVLGNT